MDVIDASIYKCLDELDTLLIQDLSLGQWKQEDENDEKNNSVQVLNCIFKLLDTNDSLKANTNLLFVLKCIYQKHKRLFENLDYDDQDLDTDNLPIESYSLRKYWKQIYPQLTRILIDNLIQNDLDNLIKQFRFSEILEFFILIERTNFWPFYQQIKKERLIVLGRNGVKQLVDRLIKTLDYEIQLICNHRYLQNLIIEYSDYILIYSNQIKDVVVSQLDLIKNQPNNVKVNILLSTIKDLNRLDEAVKCKSKLWTKLDLPNSVNQKRLQWDYKEYFIKKDYFNFLLNELNKELNTVTSDEDKLNSIVLKNKSKLLASFVNIIKVLDRYNLIYVKQLKKAFMVIVEVNINQFIQIKFSKLIKRMQLNEIYLYLNTLYFVKESFSNYGIDSNKVNELISDLESEFKAKHLFVINLNVNFIGYYICYLNTIQINLLNLANHNLFQAQKLYQDLLQEALVQLEERDLSSDDLVMFISNLPDLAMFTYDNDNLFLESTSPFQKIMNKFCWKLLFKITLLNAPLKSLNNELSKIDDKLIADYDGHDKHNWLLHFNPVLFDNLPYYHALVCNKKSVKHFIFICRPFIEFRFKLTIELIYHLIKYESNDKDYRKNRNRLLKSIFNLITTCVNQLNSLSLIILPFIQNHELNFDCIQFELLLDDSLYKKHSTKLNQLDWLFSLVKLVKQLISTQFEIILNNFLFKYLDLISVIELNSSIQHLFNKLNLKYLVSESYLIDELTESILELVSDTVLILPNGLFYSLELIAKDLKSNDLLIFNSLTAHIILFAICKQMKSRLKSLLNQDFNTIVYSKIVGNLLAWLTFSEDHDLNKYRNKFNELILRRKINLNLDYMQFDENEQLESLFRLIEINYDHYSNDIDLLDNFLKSNNEWLNAKLKNQQFNEKINLHYVIQEANKLEIIKLYQRTKFNYDQSVKQLETSFDYDQLLRLAKVKTNKSFIKKNLLKRLDFNSDNQIVNELKKTFQIT